MGGKLSSNANNTRQQNRGGLAHATSAQFDLEGDEGTSSSSGRSDQTRVRARTLNDFEIDSRPVSVPHGLFAARYSGDYGFSSASPPARNRRRLRRNRDDVPETNSLPSHLFSSLLTGGLYLRCFYIFEICKLLTMINKQLSPFLLFQLSHL